MRRLIILAIILALFSACSHGGGGDNDDESCPVIVASDAHHEVYAQILENGMTMVTTIDFGPNADVEAIRAAVTPPRCTVPTAPTSPVTDVENCFSFIDDSVPIWTVAEDVIVDPSNGEGMDEDQIVALYASAVATWESSVSSNLFGEIKRGEVGKIARALLGVSANGKNEVVFGDVSFRGALATTFSFYENGIMRESDVVFNEIDYDWSTDATGRFDQLDFLSVATHECGHTIGLGHPNSTDTICSEQTMWFTALFGEIKKRDLGEGDTAGAQLLYGAP